MPERGFSIFNVHEDENEPDNTNLRRFDMASLLILFIFSIENVTQKFEIEEIRVICACFKALESYAGLRVGYKRWIVDLYHDPSEGTLAQQKPPDRRLMAKHYDATRIFR